MQAHHGSLPIPDDVVRGRCVAMVAGALARHRDEVSHAIRDLLAAKIDELRGDPALIDLLGASVEGNVETILHVLLHDLPPREVELPPAAVEYARRLAQRGVPVNALVRAYRLGQAHLMAWAFAEMEAHRDIPSADVAAASQHIVLTVFEYVDHVSQHVVAVYEGERDRWLENRHALRVARIRDVLDGRAPAGPDERLAVESLLGYRFAPVHLGLVAWLDRTPPAGSALVTLERCAHQLADALGATGRALVVPWDTTSAWVWLPGITAVDRAAVGAAVARVGEPVRVACGAPAAGIEGFRTTHEQALRARAVTLAAGEDAPAVTVFDEVGAVALLCADLEGATAWVRRVLGPLADQGARPARLRETLRVFLATGGSNTATADQLGIHPSTVKYRVRRATEVRGRAVGADRLDVELALLARAWLGAGRDA